MYAVIDHLPLVIAGESGSIWESMTRLGIPSTEKVIRTIVVYLGILVILRLAGKRLMAQMNSFDLVVVLLLSNVVQNAVIGEDNSLAGGLLGAAVLVVANAGIERLAHRVGWIRQILQGRPTAIVQDGQVDESALRHLGMTHSELREALRHQGADSLSEVACAELEPGGGVTVDLRPEDQAASRAELAAAVAEIKAYIDAVAQRPAIQ